MVTTHSPAASPSYLGAAFLQQYNLILFGGSALFSLASASPIPFAVSAGLELLWLGIGPRLPAFRRWVDQRRDAAARLELDDSITTAMQALDGVYTSRLLALERKLESLRSVALAQNSPEELTPTLADLDSVRPGALRLCQLHQRLSRFLSHPSDAELEQEIARLDQAFTQERDLGVRFTLRQAIVMAQKRKQERDRVRALRRALELRLEMLEKSVNHLVSRSEALLSSAELRGAIDELLAQLASVEALEAEAAEMTPTSQPSPPLAEPERATGT